MGKLLFKETVSHKLPVDFTKSFEVAGYKHARFIVRSPYVSLLSFTGEMALLNSKNEVLGKLLVNKENDCGPEVPVRLIEVRRKRATWLSADYIGVSEITQNNSLVTVNLSLDWRKKDSMGMQRNKDILFEINVRVSEK